MATAQALMQRIGEKIAERKELLSSVGAVFKFALEGDGGGTYLVDLKSELKVSEGDGPAACTIRMTASDFVDLFEGRANGQALFFGGRLRVEGDMGLALKLQALTDVVK
jgi:predicted lipid carrier protein YhbT